MSNQGASLPEFRWRGPWILVIFPSEMAKWDWLKAQVFIFFNHQEGEACVVGTMEDLLCPLSGPDAYQMKLMLDIVDCKPTWDNLPTSISAKLDGQDFKFPILPN